MMGQFWKHGGNSMSDSSSETITAKTTHTRQHGLVIEDAIDEDEVERAVFKMKTGKAPGRDNNIVVFNIVGRGY